MMIVMNDDCVGYGLCHGWIKDGWVDWPANDQRRCLQRGEWASEGELVAIEPQCTPSKILKVESDSE